MYGHADRVVGWREHQEEAAALSRSLGLEVTVEERLDGARAGHDVDVVVRGRRAGVERLWVVEREKHRRRVEKLHVAALATIMGDVGADRGVLLSEVGFQTGTVQVARTSTITSTSLAELREEAGEELLVLRLGQCRLRLA